MDLMRMTQSQSWPRCYKRILESRLVRLHNADMVTPYGRECILLPRHCIELHLVTSLGRIDQKLFMTPDQSSCPRSV